jgi:hypothetical protein
LPDGATEWFVLDSGASSTILDAKVARRLGLAVQDEGTQGGAGPGRTAAGSAKGVPLFVGEVLFSPGRVMVYPLDDLLSPSGGRHAPGVVGAAFFAEHVLELDFERRTLAVFPPGTARPGTPIPVELNGGTPLVRGTLTLGSGRALPARLLVDLGAKATALVAEPFMARNEVKPSGPVQPLGAGLGGETRYAWKRVRLIEVGGFALRGAVDMSGMFLLARGPSLREYEVSALVPEGPAAAAGVRKGDVLAALDGEPAQARTLSQVREALKSGDGRTVALDLLRGEAKVSVRLRLRRLP